MGGAKELGDENKMSKKTKINLPNDVDEPVSTKVGNYIVFVELVHDQDAMNPCDMDGMGHVWSFNRNHSNYLRDFEFPDTKDACRTKLYEQYGKDIVVLGYFEHGGSIWHVEDELPAGTEGDYQWDGVSFAGIWEPDRTILDVIPKGKHTGKARRTWMLKQARACCETYTQWCNGEVYGYDIEAFKQRMHSDDERAFDEPDDYRFDDAVYNDSCFGYYGRTSVQEAMRESAASCLKALLPK